MIPEKTKKHLHSREVMGEHFFFPLVSILPLLDEKKNYLSRTAAVKPQIGECSNILESGANGIINTGIISAMNNSQGKKSIQSFFRVE